VTAQTTAGRPRLRELRTELGWTQQLTDKLNYVAWSQGQGRAAVNADMVVNWERGVKGLSPRYRALLCQLFGVTAEQLRFAPAWVSSWRLPLLRRARWLTSGACTCWRPP
jgi:transcriptional regulator with XRE-family HTH domain